MQGAQGIVLVNVLSRTKQVAVLAAIVNGSSSERRVAEMTGVNRATVSRLGLKFGEGSRRLHNRLVRDLSCHHVEPDEQWGYCTKKQKRVTPDDPAEFGEQYTFIALDKSSRLVVSFHVGKRDAENTRIFINDLRRRLVVIPDVTSDGWRPYIDAIAGNFGTSVNYLQTVKNYTKGGRRNGGSDHRYEPPREPFIRKEVVYGAPDVEHGSTAYVERFNGTARAFIGRMKRLSYSFSKRVEHHRAAWALAIAHYNLCHIVRTLRVTPAVQAGITDHVWGLEEFYDVIVSEPPCDVPSWQAIGHREPETTHRELPGGRGFLRVVKPGVVSPTSLAPRVPGASETVQLGLFDDDPKTTA